MAYADRWPRGEALRRHRLWSRRQECTWLALRLWEGPHCHHTRTSVVLCCRHGHHPAAALPDAGRKRFPSPQSLSEPLPQNIPGGEAGRRLTPGSAVGWSREGPPAALGAPARQFPSPPSSPSCENLTTDTEVRVDGELAGTGAWDTSLSFCTGCGEWREWGEQPESFSEAGHTVPRLDEGAGRAFQGEGPVGTSAIVRLRVPLRPHQGSASSSCPPQDHCSSVPGRRALPAACGTISAVAHGPTTAPVPLHTRFPLASGHQPRPSGSPFVVGYSENVL